MSVLDKLLKNNNNEEANNNKEAANTQQPITKTKKQKLSKEEFQKQKEERRQAAQAKREEEARLAKIKAEEEAVKKEAEMRIREEELAQERLQKEEQKKAKQNKTAKKKVEEDDDFELFGFSLKDIQLKDIVELEVLQEDGENYIGNIVGNFQEVLLPKSETVEDIKIGNTYKAVVYYRKDGVFSVSQKKVNTMNTVAELNELYANNETITGTIKFFKDPFFIVEVKDGFLAKLYKFNYQLEPIRDFDALVGQTAEFLIKEKDLGGKYGFELTRKPIIEAALKDKLKDINEGTVVNVNENYNINKGGIDFDLDGLRIFIPFNQIDHQFVNKDTDLSQFINADTKAEIIEIKNRRNRVDIVASIKKLAPNPFDAFIKTVNVGDVLTGKVERIEKYGLFIGLSEQIRGLLHQNDFSNELSAEIKNVKIGDELSVEIKEIDDENKRINLKSNN